MCVDVVFKKDYPVKLYKNDVNYER